jgi:hypothetical protein
MSGWVTNNKNHIRDEQSWLFGEPFTGLTRDHRKGIFATAKFEVSSPEKGNGPVIAKSCHFVVTISADENKFGK